MPKVMAVSAFSPLPVKHLSTIDYRQLGGRLVSAIPNNIVVYDPFPLEKCWLHPWRALPHADKRLYPDRYAEPAHMSLSSVIQHNRTSWGLMAAKDNPDADVIVWLDYGILKQGDFTGKPVKEQHVADFIERLGEQELDDIPFPGIWDRMTVGPGEANWRFCGSTHIWPRKYLEKIDYVYKQETLRFIEQTGTLPYDMTIWATIERHYPLLPWRWYRANHDATQLTAFQHRPKKTPLCELAAKYGTDKHEPAGYTPVYHDLFWDRRAAVKRVLEIGICGGRDIPNNVTGASLYMWADYFPNAQVYGLDIDPQWMVNTDRIHSAIANQGSALSLIDAVNAFGAGKFDLIVDDGSHKLAHQLISAHVLLPFLAEGGVYVIEDIGNWTSPDTEPRDIISHLPAGYSSYVVGEKPHGLIVIRKATR